MIYLVEDDSSIRELVIYALNSTGLEAKGFEKPSEFWKAVEEEEPSLVILDVMLPFSMMEMVARVKALIRRSEYKHEEKDYTINNLYVCPIKHLVKVDDREVVLTLKEYEMLCLLLKNRGIVLSREQLLNKIWGYSFDGESRTVDVHVRTLRQKLGTAGDVIKTIRGVGYKISA